VILIHVINRQSFGWTFLFSVDWPTLAASVPAIFLAAVAAVVPAYRRALRQSPASLLREQP
jgi:putative ABC transport system permease protein